MKKVVLTMFIALAAISMVFANGQSESKSAQASSNGGVVDLTLWSGAAVTEAGPLPDDWVGYQIIRDKLGINLKFTTLPSALTDQDVKIQAAGAANALPDVFMVSRPVLTNLVKQGLVAQIDDLYDMMPTRTAKYHSDPDARHYADIDGKNYGMAVPVSIKGNEGLVIRKDWLDKLGLEVPKTLDELYDVMYAFTFNDPDGNGKNDTWGYGAFVESNSVLKGYPGSRIWPLMGAFGVAGLWSMEEETLGLSIYEPEFYDFMVWFKKICDEGLIDPNWMSYKKDDFRAAWKQGRFGIMKEQWAALTAESNYLPFDMNFPQGEWIVIAPPIGPNGESSVGALDKTFNTFAVSAKAVKEGKLETIAKFFEWLGTDEGYYLLGYGTEGINYNFDANGNPSGEGLGDNSYQGVVGQIQTQLRNLVCFNDANEFSFRFPDYVTKNSKKVISPTSVLKAMEDSPWTVVVGSNSMPTPNADVFRYYEQSLAEFLTGSKALTPENWQKFLDDFAKVGGADWNQKGIEYARENNYVR